MKIALLGYGTVGKSVEELLKKRDLGIEIKYILRKKGKADAPYMTDSYEEILGDPEIECVVEALSGIEPALTYLRLALESGKHVVSANKAALAADFGALSALAAEKHCFLLYEASCGGGIPWIENIKKAVRLDRITTLRGILNGTGNYILDHMERFGLSFDEVLKSAQKLGYAEADPTADIGGFDVRNKALISSSVAYGTPVTGDFPVAGIELITKELLDRFRAEGKSIRHMMLSVRKEDRYALGVVPCVLPSDSLEANVQDNYNCASLCGDFVGTLKFYGQGAGGFPTADAVLQDLISIKTRTAEAAVLDRKLFYDPELLCGKAYLGEKIICGKTLSELCAMAKEAHAFLAFEPEEN